MARPTKLTDELSETICKAIRLGLTIEQAARHAGITDRTLYRWKKQGQETKKGAFCQFCQALQQAEIEAEMLHLQRMHYAAIGNYEQVEVRKVIKADGTVETTEIRKKQPQWKASAWILERRYPEKYGRVKPVGPNGYDGMYDMVEALQKTHEEVEPKDIAKEPSLKEVAA
jgi:transposase-like protein